MGGRAWGLFAAVSVLWGVPYLFIGVALDDGIGPVAVAAGRVLPAAAVLVPLALRRRRNAAPSLRRGHSPLALRQRGCAPLRGRLGRLAVLAVVEVVVPFSLIPIGEQTVSSGLAGVLIATEPMFVLLTGLALGSRGRPSGAAVAGLAVGFGGVVVLLGVDGAGPGVAPLVVAAAFYAVGAVLVDRWFGDVPALVVVAGMLAIAAPVLTVLALLTGPLPAPSWAGVAALAALGLVATPVGFVAFFALIGLAGPDRAALITYVAPVVAVLAGAVVLAEPVGARTLAGTALILAGAWLATRSRRSRRIRPPFPPLPYRRRP